MSTPRVQTSRRTSLALAVTAPLALAACEIDPPSARSSATPSASPSTPPLPDTDVVTAARTAILSMVAAAETVTAAHPRLGRELDAWLSLHSAHLEVLLDDSGDDTEAPADGVLPAPRAASARARFVSDEGRLAGTLADLAREAASGDLARVLASMSAAVTQRVTT